MDDFANEQVGDIMNCSSYGFRNARSSADGSSSSEDYQGDDGQGLRGAGLLQAHQRRKRKRKPKQRTWKPYSELSWDERRVLEDRDSKRAYAKRDKLSAEGHPIAPYNTTQFLMADHKQKTPDSKEELKGKDEIKKTVTTLSVSTRDPQPHPVCVRSEKDHRSDVRVAINGIDQQEYINIANANDADHLQEFILEDFSNTYADIHAEHLQTLTKTDLITEYLQLEKKVELLEKKLKDTRKKHRENTVSADSVKKLLEKITQLQQQNQQLQEVIPVSPALPFKSDDSGSTGSVDS